jgi:hypothetical protein
MTQKQTLSVGMKSAAAIVGTLCLALFGLGVLTLVRHGFSWGGLSLTLGVGGVGADLLVAAFTGHKPTAVEFFSWFWPTL